MKANYTMPNGLWRTTVHYSTVDGVGRIARGCRSPRSSGLSPLVRRFYRIKFEGVSPTCVSIWSLLLTPQHRANHIFLERHFIEFRKANKFTMTGVNIMISWAAPRQPSRRLLALTRLALAASNRSSECHQKAVSTGESQLLETTHAEISRLSSLPEASVVRRGSLLAHVAEFCVSI